MPVTFAPAEPVSAAIGQQFGAAEQWNHAFPALSQLYQSQQHNQIARDEMATRVGIASAENATRAGIARDETDARFQTQREDIAARLYGQQQAMSFDAAMQDRKFGQQDYQRMQRMQAGLAQLQSDVDAGYLSKQDAAAAAYELKTGSSYIDQQMKKQHAEDFAAQAQMHLQRAGLENAVLSKNLQHQAKTASDNAQLDPQAEMLERDALLPKYRAMAAVMGEPAAQAAMEKEVRDNVIRKGKYRVLIGVSSHGTAEYKDMHGAEDKTAAKEVGGGWAHLGAGGRYSEAKGRADAKAFTEGELGPRPKPPGKDDPNAATVNEAIKAWDDLARRRQDGTRREFRQAAAGAPAGASPDNTPGQDAQAQNDQRPPDLTSPQGIDRAMSDLSGLGPNLASTTRTQMAELKAIIQDNKSPTPEVVRHARELKDAISAALQTSGR